VLLLGCAASLVWLVHPWYEATRETADAAIYILCAKSLMAGEGYSTFGLPFTVRPPGFSVLLIPLLATRGLDFHALNLLVASSGLLAIACLFVLARPRLGNAGAAAVALALWTNPGFRRLSNQIMSDVPGLALALACVALCGWAARRPSVLRDATLGIAIALAAYIRSSAVLILAALLLPRFQAWLGQRAAGNGAPLLSFLRAQVLVPVLVPLALLAPWGIRNALHHPPWPADQTLLASYSTGMWHVDGGNPSSPRVSVTEVLARVPAQLPTILHHVGGRLDAGMPSGASQALGIVLLLALLFAAIGRRSTAAIFALLLLATLAVYFAVDWRLALPVYALGLLATAEGLRELLTRLLPARVAGAVVTTILLVLAALDSAPRQGWDGIRARHEAELAFADALDSRLAADDTLAAPAGWHLAVLLDRPVWNLAHAGRRRGLAGIRRVIEERGISAVVIRTVPNEAPNMLAMLEASYGPGERIGPGILVRTQR